MRIAPTPRNKGWALLISHKHRKEITLAVPQHVLPGPAGARSSAPCMTPPLGYPGKQKRPAVPIYRTSEPSNKLYTNYPAWSRGLLLLPPAPGNLPQLNLVKHLIERVNPYPIDFFPLVLPPLSPHIHLVGGDPETPGGERFG